MQALGYGLLTVIGVACFASPGAAADEPAPQSAVRLPVSSVALADDLGSLPAANATPAPVPLESVVDVVERYQRPSPLPILGPTPSGPMGILGPPNDCYYAARARNWIQADYLLWWFGGQKLPVLAQGANGNPVFGGTRFDSTTHNGFRIRGGHFFNCDGDLGIMFDLLGFGSESDRRAVAAPAGGGLTLPFTDMDLSLATNQNGCACLDDLVGTASTVPVESFEARTSTEFLSGGLYGRSRLKSMYDCCRRSCCCNGGLDRLGFRVDALYGYRHFSLDEALTLTGVLTPATGRIQGTDRFRTQNDFHGFDMGLLTELEEGRWSLTLLGKFAIGLTDQRLRIQGTGNQNGGIFAQPTNIGSYDNTAVTVIPEGSCTLSYALTCNLRARFGYSIMWISNVIRPAAQVDRRIDGRFLDATSARPLNNPLAFFPRERFEAESLFAHGLNFGLEYWF